MRKDFRAFVAMFRVFSHRIELKFLCTPDFDIGHVPSNLFGLSSQSFEPDPNHRPIEAQQQHDTHLRHSRRPQTHRAHFVIACLANASQR